jgi:hypothetical protein
MKQYNSIYKNNLKENRTTMKLDRYKPLFLKEAIQPNAQALMNDSDKVNTPQTYNIESGPVTCTDAYNYEDLLYNTSNYKKALSELEKESNGEYYFSSVKDFIVGNTDYSYDYDMKIYTDDDDAKIEESDAWDLAVENFVNSIEDEKTQLAFIDDSFIEKIMNKASINWNSSNMTEYLENPLKNKIIEITLDSELLSNGNAKFVVKTNTQLSEDDKKELLEWLSGQLSDGWGEGFEQDKLLNRYYVHFWDYTLYDIKFV